MGQKYYFNLPTLDDPTRPGVNEGVDGGVEGDWMPAENLDAGRSAQCHRDPGDPQRQFSDLRQWRQSELRQHGRYPHAKENGQIRQSNTARTVGNVGSHPPSLIWASSQFRERLPSTSVQGSSGESRIKTFFEVCA